MQNYFQFALAMPEILLLLMACAVLLIDAFCRSQQRQLTYSLSLYSLVVLMAVTLWQWNAGMGGVTFHGLYVVDPLSHFLKLLCYLTVFVTLVYGRRYADERGMTERGGELYSLTLIALLGQMVMISA